ncbi:hypothetical protein [Methyloversatilis thermotolerans]|uniref:hypothetical protein n=1 Tax=Methyloversatilis thermotolerans TaxID=1346290 RepID=UPI00036621BC|nr:hypothetical protein [Methyloversatilis thermotolerans]
MLRQRPIRFGLVTLLVAGQCALAHGFSFSEEAAKDAANAEAEKAAADAKMRSLPPACLDGLRRKTVLLIMGERSGDGISAEQARFSPHFNAINRRLQKQGMRTYTQAEIRARIAQAEVDAYFRNDPDAALAASKKLGAQLILRGTIDARTTMNAVVRLPEVQVTIAYALLTPSGQLLSEARTDAESYSGSDTLGMARMLIEEKADGVVNELLAGYCDAQPAAVKSGAKKTNK